MNWNERILESGSGSLAARVNALIEQQKQSWPMLVEGYEALARAETKRVESDGSELIIQHNPRRIHSTSARVDKEGLEARRCFLCPDSLPPEEKAISYGDLLILCNPFPILAGHLSIVHRDHVEQKIEGNVAWLLGLARELAPDYFVLYNGPRCGASAPDHLHFQACREPSLPIEQVAAKGDPPPPEQCDICSEGPRDEFELFTVTDFGRTAVVFRSNNEMELERWIYETLAALPVEAGDDEPMVNIIMRHDRERWAVYLFPRARHRPACYFAEGGERLTVSPGAIDMAGIVVVPQREHFDRLDGPQTEHIFSEVSQTEAAVNEMVERLCSSLDAEEVL